MTATFLTGHAIEVLRTLPADHFHAAVCSPPYYGLRSYSGAQEVVWDGDPGCQHEWGDILPGDNRGGRGPGAKEGGQGVYGRDKPRGQFCLRCGAWLGALGAEPTVDLYVTHLVQIFREVRRVLRPDGVLWVNIADSYARAGGWSNNNGLDGVSREDCKRPASNIPVDGSRSQKIPVGLKPLDKCLVPARLSLALQQGGWWVRQDCVWRKENPMPSSTDGHRWEKHRVKVKARGASSAGIDKQELIGNGNPHASRDGYEAEWQDCPGCPTCSPTGGYILRRGNWRPTTSHEYVFMLTKSASYYSDKLAVAEQAVYPEGEVREGGDGHKSLLSGSCTTTGLHDKTWTDTGFRNQRSVWSFPTAPFCGAHFAAYPPKLVWTAIRSSVSEKGCCPECGAPWARVVDKRPRGGGAVPQDGKGALGYDWKYNGARTPTQEAARGLSIEAERARSREDAVCLFPGDPNAQQAYVNHVHDHGDSQQTTVGWRPSCSCSAPATISCRVLDCFGGAGTTALVCERLNLDSTSIDISAEYNQLAYNRLLGDIQKRSRDIIASQLCQPLSLITPSAGANNEEV